MAILRDIKINPPKRRLIGRLPKVGIRPIIDGRTGGVRESLESQTMNMAKSVAKFLASNLKHSNGIPVECVIAETTIGGFAEAAKTDDKFALENIGLTISVTPCWCYGSETMDTDQYVPKAIWGFNGTEKPGAVYLAAALAAHNQKGLPAFGIYGRDVKDSTDTSIPEDVKIKLLSFAKAGLAVAEMKGKSYLAMGGVSMGIAGSIADPSFFENYLGMRYEYIDMSEFIRRIEMSIYDSREYGYAFDWVKKYCKEGPDINQESKQKSRAGKDKDWQFAIKMTLIARDLMIGNKALADLGYPEEALGHNAIAAGFQGQRQWTDYYPNADFTETILNSSFDWNGIREPFIYATENDMLNAISMLFGHLLTDTAQIFADVRTYWSPDAIKRVAGIQLEGDAGNGVIHLINSGSAALDGTGRQALDGKPAIKPYWDISVEEVSSMLDSAVFCHANLGLFRGGGYSVSFLTKGEMPLTMSRINLIKGLGPVLQIAEGYSVLLPDKAHSILNQRTDPTWPTTWFRPILTGKSPFDDTYSVMNKWGANHASLSYGHIGDKLITLASMLRIPVCMHNVSEDRIFRPSAWDAFGTSDLEGADYRACKNFGPLYGKY